MKKLVTRKPAKKRDNTLLYIYKTFKTDTQCSASDTASFLGQVDIFFVAIQFQFQFRVLVLLHMINNSCREDAVLIMMDSKALGSQVTSQIQIQIHIRSYKDF